MTMFRKRWVRIVALGGMSVLVFALTYVAVDRTDQPLILGGRYYYRSDLFVGALIAFIWLMGIDLFVGAIQATRRAMRGDTSLPAYIAGSFVVLAVLALFVGTMISMRGGSWVIEIPALIVLLGIGYLVVQAFGGFRRKVQSAPPSTTSPAPTLPNQAENVLSVVSEVLRENPTPPVVHAHPQSPPPPPTRPRNELEELRQTVARLEHEVAQLKLARTVAVLPDPILSASTATTPASQTTNVPKYLVGLGAGGVIGSVVWWAISYQTVANELRESNFTYAWKCLFQSGDVCFFLRMAASGAGHTPYEPATLWISLIVLMLGLVLKARARADR
jgi:hypothetical protein